MAIQRPSIYPDWAENLVVETIVEDGVEKQYPNKAPIPSSIQLNGLSYEQAATRQFINQEFALLAAWVKHLDNTALAVGTIWTDEDGTSTGVPADLDAVGTWSEIGTIGTRKAYRLDSKD